MPRIWSSKVGNEKLYRNLLGTNNVRVQKSMHAKNHSVQKYDFNLVDGSQAKFTVGEDALTFNISGNGKNKKLFATENENPDKISEVFAKLIDTIKPMIKP